MSMIKRLAEEMAEERGLTFAEYMSDKFPDPEQADYEPDLNGTDISEMREQMDYWRSLK